MLYRENQNSFSMEIFKDPPAEYRGVPFWAWNTAMTKEDIDFCLTVFRDMGMGGGFLHSRTGMDIPYLGPEFMELIRYAHEEARKLGLKAWLYDEDRWPSGFAGGLVTACQEYRARYLVWSPLPLRDGEIPEDSPKGSTAQAVRSKNRRLLGIYRVEGKDGYLQNYERISRGGEEEEGLWRAYVEICGDNPWFNGQSYVDTLNPKAVRAFIDSTYEPYRELLGRDFGEKIPAIFTDEPQFTPKGRADAIDSRRPVILPFTDRLPELFQENFGFDLLDCLPELFYEKKEGYSRVRYCYHELVSRMFADSYCRQLGDWCAQNNIRLTGHLMKEPLLSSQTAYVGEAMRAYAGFQIPGMDLLCDRREFTTAKQVQSAVRQFGREAMISELYGVTNWSFDFRGHKLQGDWQAALGVTIRAPHLAWTSMEGEAKRDYPASIFYQSPWYREYKLIEDYFARIASVMSRGKAVTDIGVIHPAETCWLLWGTREKTGDAIRELDERFVGLTDWLLGQSLDFDFISESLIPELYRGIAGDCCLIGQMKYKVLIVPFMETMRSTTADMLEDWKKAGGRVIFLGGAPGYTDGLPSDRVEKLAEDCKVFGSWGWRLRKELQDCGQVELFYEDHQRAEDLLCQVRQEGEKRYLFVAHKYAPEKPGLVTEKTLVIRTAGGWRWELLDPLNGTARSLAVKRSRGYTTGAVRFFDHDSVLMVMTPEEGSTAMAVTESSAKMGKTFREFPVQGSCPVTLSEPNVLVLDMAEYSFDGQQRQSREEILRIDNRLRTLAGYPLRTEAWPQPWTRKNEDQAYGIHQVELRYEIWSEIHVSHVELGLEQPEQTGLSWNGEPVEIKETGWYADRRIKTTGLGELKKGRNELKIVREFHEKANLEALYLLGDFGVRVQGRRAVVTEPVRELDFGDWTDQGLPFYGGNVTYHLKLTAEREGEQAGIQISNFTVPVIRADLDGKKQGLIAFSPYRLMTEPLPAGRHKLDVTAYGNRVNTFGALHNSDMEDNRSAPDYWRTTGCGWSYEYCIRPMGILKTPVITFFPYSIC